MAFYPCSQVNHPLQDISPELQVWIFNHPLASPLRSLIPISSSPQWNRMPSYPAQNCSSHFSSEQIASLFVHICISKASFCPWCFTHSSTSTVSLPSIWVPNPKLPQGFLWYQSNPCHYHMPPQLLQWLPRWSLFRSLFFLPSPKNVFNAAMGVVSFEQKCYQVTGLLKALHWLSYLPSLSHWVPLTSWWLQKGPCVCASSCVQSST